MSGPGGIVVGYDGTLGAVSALRHAFDIAGPDEPIVAVGAIGQERSLPAVLRALERRGRVRRRIEDAWAEDGEVLEGDVELIERDGRPADVLAAVAQERGARTIVVGHERRESPGAVLTTSVARDLVDTATVPVVVVPA